jgi:hypothetical protein
MYIDHHCDVMVATITGPIGMDAEVSPRKEQRAFPANRPILLSLAFEKAASIML